MSNEHFLILDDAISPQPWMQYRTVATAQAASVSKSYGTAGGGAKDELVQTVTAQWTNNTPIAQSVYGMVTRGGAQVTLQARSRGYLSTRHGVAVAASPPGSISTAEVSRFGIGGDYGVGGALAIGTGFAVSEIRQHSASVPLMPNQLGWYVVAPGETFYGKVDIRFVSEFWESTSIDGGDSGTESGFTSGDTRLDLFAIPAVVAPTPRPTPTIVGVRHDIAVSDDTDVNVPAGTAEGDVLLAIVANQFGTAADITAGAGWTQLTVVNDGLLGLGDVHLKAFMRQATASEPASYAFGNGFLAESIAQIITIRNASAQLIDGWYVAFTLRRFILDRFDTGLCPTITRDGKLLICASYMRHLPPQSPLTQTPPTAMTELADTPGNTSTLATAYMAAPPNPTGARRFVPSVQPVFSGHSIALTILVPGSSEIP